MKCLILSETVLFELVQRYDGIGKPLTNEEREILLFALYNESDLVKRARASYLQKLARRPRP